jgi:hypothetical protein
MGARDDFHADAFAIRGQMMKPDWQDATGRRFVMGPGGEIL